MDIALFAEKQYSSIDNQTAHLLRQALTGNSTPVKTGPEISVNTLAMILLVGHWAILR